MKESNAIEILNLCFENSLRISELVQENQDIKRIIDITLKESVETIFGMGRECSLPLGKLGTIDFPFKTFGNVTTLDLINFSEFCLFKIYELVANQYDYALDLGANVGLHSVVMARSGFKKIVAVEADKAHEAIFLDNLNRNGIDNVQLVNGAISDQRGVTQFNRLLGNTTGSHITGAKSKVYGEVEQFEVQTIPISDFITPGSKVFVKMDIEGHEAVAMEAIPEDLWDQLDIVFEIGSTTSATKIFNYSRKFGISLLCERLNWKLAVHEHDLPVNWRGGSVIATRNNAFIANLARSEP